MSFPGTFPGVIKVESQRLWAHPILGFPFPLKRAPLIGDGMQLDEEVGSLLSGCASFFNISKVAFAPGSIR